MSTAPVLIAAKVTPALKQRVVDLAHSRKQTVSAVIIAALNRELENEL